MKALIGQLRKHWKEKENKIPEQVIEQVIEVNENESKNEEEGNDMFFKRNLLNFPEIHIMIGIPGSGKTTVAKEIVSKLEKTTQNGVVYLSSDDIREQLTGDANNQDVNEQVFGIIHRKIKEATKYNKDVVFDATNINLKSRRANFNCIKNPQSYYIVADVICVPYEECVKRAKEREERPLPEWVLKKMIKKFEIPFYEEGFNLINFIYEGEVYNKNYSYHPYNEMGNVITHFTEPMKGFDQKNQHHIHDLYDHSRIANEYAINNWQAAMGHKPKNLSKSFVLGSWLHDYGKLFTGEPKEDGSGDYTYRQHYNVGAYMLMSQYKDFVCGNFDEMLDALFLINYHMIPFFLGSEKKEEKQKKIFGEPKFQWLMLFNDADKKASKD